MTLELRRLAGGMHVDRVGIPDAADLLERLEDEDEGDEDGEAFLREAGDVADEGAQVKGDDEEEEERHPRADPEAEGEEIEVVFPE